MNRPADSGTPESDTQQRLRDLTMRLEKAWNEGVSVDLEQFLPGAGEALREPALQALIRTDLEIRWRRGQRFFLEGYLAQFPELGGGQTILQLICEEYRIRHLYGDRPPLGTYRERFPERFEELQETLRSQSGGSSAYATLEPAITKSSSMPVLTSPQLSPPRDVVARSGDRATPATPAVVPRSGDRATPAMPAVVARSGNPATSETRQASDYNILPIGGGYKKIKLLGRGGYGEVWRAEAPGNVEVAVKIIFRPLDHDDSQRELQSLELIKQLRHPFLVQTHAYWSLEDRLLIAMELADGSLRDRLAECRRAGETGIPAEELFAYFREAAEALDYLHSQQVQHRDIKPDNILLSKQHAKVADFGLARLLQNQLSIHATTAGTPAYMAPEIWSGHVSQHSDQYSLAASYVELRLGRPMFSSTAMFSVMMDHLEQKPDLSLLPEAEQQVLHKALAKESGQRYPSCLAFVQALDKALHPPPPPPPPPPPVPPTRWPLVAGLSALTVLLLLGWFAWRYLWRGPFALSSPPPLSLRVGGEAKSIVIGSQNRTGQEKIELDFRDVPPHIAISQETLPGTPDNVQVHVQALSVAATGTYPVTIQAVAGQHRAEPTILSLTVEPPEWPPQCQRVEGEQIESIGGKEFYKRVTFVLTEGPRVTFVLIPRKTPEDLETFYIMENKVSNELFARFALANPDVIRKDGWESGGVIEEAGKRRDLKNIDGQLPVLRVTVDEANRFAQWFGGPSKGRLPSARQWDQAAGRSDPNRGLGPFGRWPLLVAFNRARTGPMRITDDTRDISSFGCRHMSANGLEWTRTLHRDTREVPLANPTEDDHVVLRGRGYSAPVPLTWEQLESDDKDRAPEVCRYSQTDPEIGFRIVIEP